jgi:hypothetical protein
MATINSPAIAIELQALQPRSFPIDAPVTAFALAAFPPSVYEVPTGVFTVCTLNPTPPSSGDTTGPFLPLPEGFDPDDLPLLDSGDIVDTSPNQIIGCVDILVEGYEQNILNALFPGAVAGDGVVARETEDIWKYDGTIWENVGPSPGPTILPRPVVPLIQYIERYDASIHTRLQIQSLDYALALLTEPDPIGVVLGLDAIKITLVKIPTALDLDLELQIPVVEIRERPISLVLSPYAYEPTGSALTVDVGYEPGIVWTQRPVGSGIEPYTFDILRGPTIYMRLRGFQVEQTDAQSITAFTSEGFTVGTSTRLNNVSSVSLYTGHAFRSAAASASDTSGTITSSVAVGNVYSVVTYTGNGTAGATVGHGMSSAPQFILLYRRGPSQGEAHAGGPVIGDNHTIILDLYENRTSSTLFIRSTSSTTFTLGNSSDVNASGSTYLAYAFRNEVGVSKIDTYTGDGDPAGQFIDCGLIVDYLLVKRRDGGVDALTEWCVFDRTDMSGTRVVPLVEGSPTFIPEPNHRFEGKGFVALSGDEDVYYDINESGATYMYMAFARIIPTVNVPSATIELEALLPSV